MSIAQMIRRMADAGATPEAIAIAVEALEATEAKDAARRAKRAEQKRQERDRRATVATTSRDTPPSDKEKSPKPPKEITSPHSPPKGGSYTPRDELARVLDAERASAVVAHRQRLGKAMTAYAAKLLAAQFAKCPDPNAAADAMIANGWQGFKPEWLESRTAPRQTAPPKQTVGQQARDELRRMMNNAPDHETRHFLESDGSADFTGSGLARRFALSPGGRGGH